MSPRKKPGGGHHGGDGKKGGKPPDLPPAVQGPLKHAVPSIKKPTPHGRMRPTVGGHSPTSQTPGGHGPGGTNPMHPVTPGWTRVDAQHAPQHVRDAARGFNPRESGRARPTTGVYNGQTRTSSDGRNRKHLADDLAHDRIPREGGRPYSQAPNLLYEHPEMQAAADMRRRIRENPDANVDTEVVVDNSTCGTRSFDRDKPLTCDKLLADSMPAGSKMTVWATTDGGQTFYQSIIHGTGRLIRP
jgi:hypothetical protein